MPPRPRERLIRIRLRGMRSHSYSIRIGSGTLFTIPRAIRSLVPARRYFVITDSEVRRLHGGRFLALLRRGGLSAELLSVPAGEASKSREEKARLEDRMLERGAGRDSAIVALGGGVICDLAGFVAATYQRGIPFVPVPTTLLAMVDAAVGGKTAVDHPRGKNLIGAFHQPRAVFTDVGFLRTLPPREFRSGLAEVIKSAVVGDARLFEGMERDPARALSRDPEALVRLVAACCRVKARVVAADERELHLRSVLNFGHTLGHALEHLVHYTLSHGEAVAIGMALEAKAAEKARILKKGDAERIAGLLRAVGLPARLPEKVSPARLLAAALADKKAEGGRIRYALPLRIGEMARRGGRHAFPLPDRIVLAAMRQ